MNQSAERAYRLGFPQMRALCQDKSTLRVLVLAHELTHELAHRASHVRRYPLLQLEAALRRDYRPSATTAYVMEARQVMSEIWHGQQDVPAYF